ncbi:hypothetical protein M885DRAFT_440503, partial [Pelagophyceae sp. CCMP2097]
LRQLLQQPENAVCADCNAEDPTWASTTLGVFLCLCCAGVHRSLGSHLSFVLSTRLDDAQWSVPAPFLFAGDTGGSAEKRFWTVLFQFDLLRGLLAK